MHVIAKPILRAFWQTWPDAEAPLLRWHTLLTHVTAQDFAALKAVFGTADWVKGHVVFDIGGNKYRIVCDVVFRSQTAYIKHVFTHQEYDAWQP